IVAAFRKLGIPTMMSALPSLAISSLIAGVSALEGIGGTVPRRAVRGTVRSGELPARHRDDRPVVVGCVRDVAAVGALVDQRPKAETSPRRDETVDRRPNERRYANQLALAERSIEQALALGQWDVEQARAGDLEGVDRDEGERTVWVEAALGRDRPSAAATDDELGHHLAAARRLDLGHRDARDHLCRLDRQEAVEDQLEGLRRARDGPRDAGELTGAVEPFLVAEHRVAIADASEDANAGPARLDDRIAHRMEIGR